MMKPELSKANWAANAMLNKHNELAFSVAMDIAMGQHIRTLGQEGHCLPQLQVATWRIHIEGIMCLMSTHPCCMILVRYYGQVTKNRSKCSGTHPTQILYSSCIMLWQMCPASSIQYTSAGMCSYLVWVNMGRDLSLKVGKYSPTVFLTNQWITVMSGRAALLRVLVMLTYL